MRVLADLDPVKLRGADSRLGRRQQRKRLVLDHFLLQILEQIQAHVQEVPAAARRVQHPHPRQPVQKPIPYRADLPAFVGAYGCTPWALYTLEATRGNKAL